jgi:hypothetical protein
LNINRLIVHIHNLSIHPSDNNSDLEPEACREQVRQNIEYDIWMQSKSDDEKDLVEEIYQIICDVVCKRQEITRIGSQYYPYEVVKSRFLKLNTFHVQYVIKCMKNTYTRINNIFPYLRTVLYNDKLMGDEKLASSACTSDPRIFTESIFLAAFGTDAMDSYMES